MKRLVLIVVIIPTLLFSQGWERTYGDENPDYGYSGKQTADGGYIITGCSYLGVGLPGYAFLIKTDINGDTLWTKTYFGELSSSGRSVQQTNDGGYIVISPSNWGLLIKTDTNGDTLWTKSLGGWSVKQTIDSGYIIVSDTYLIKTDTWGDTLWEKPFGGFSGQQTTDGGYIVTGYTSSFGYGDDDVYLVKTDNNGDTVWTKTFGGNENDIGISVQQTTDGGYIVTGYTCSYGNGDNDIYLIKTDNNGDTIWTKTFGGNENDIGKSVQQTIDDGYIITGITHSYGNGISDIYLIKTDVNGDTLWTKTYGGDGWEDGNSVQETNDGGYIITGITSSFGYDNVDIYLIKTDEDGIVTFTTEIPIPNPNRKLIKMVDLAGREITNPIKNVPYIEIFDNGTTQKKMIIK